MSDQILSCVKYLNPDNSIQLYVFQFSFEGVEYPNHWGEITVFAGEVQDPTNLAEVKALAISRATTVKALCATGQDMNGIVGDVTL